MSEDTTTAETQAKSFADVLAALELRPLGTARIRIVGLDGQEDDVVGAGEADVFIADSLKQPHNRVFGGQVLAQSLRAASLTVIDEHPDRLPHSLHAYFMRPGDDTQPIRLAVERMRDGRSFSTRRVHAIQHGQPILSMTASFQDPAGGLDHQDVMPEVPSPGELTSIAEIFGAIDHPRARHLAARPIDQRYVEGDIAYQIVGDTVADQNLWVRVLGEVGDDPHLHAALLAYVSDYSLLEPILRRHGRTWIDRSLRVASLDHAMWFHRPVDPTQWMLYAQHSPSAQGGRGLSLGRFFTEEGRLVATIAQEGMVRVKTDSSATG